MPDLAVTKTNNAVANSIVYGGNWTWTLTGSSATAASNFAASQTILTDNLPNSNIAYGAVTVNTIGVTGTIACSMAGSDLSCVANNAVSIAAGGSFTASFSATPTAVGTFANPRAGGQCAIDPSGVVTESSEANNSCSNTVSVTPKPVTVTADAKSKGYGVVNPPLTAVVSGAVVGGDPVNYTLATTASPLPTRR